jgi:hypothetical protein
LDLRGFIFCLALFFAALAGSAVCAFAQASSGEITGTVTDAKTNAPVANVRVTAQSPSGRYTTVTDSHGNYTFLGVLADTYSLSFAKNGYTAASIPGITLFAGAVLRENEQLSAGLATIASVHARSVGSAFQPGMTTDTYTVTGTQIQMVQGKEFNADETNLLRSIPSVTIDKSGTVAIRGGFAFEAGYEFEGIDYTAPSPNLQNTLQNIDNFSLLNGVGGVQLIPGGGDATHGNTGTGLIILTAKHGTYPSFAHLDLELGGPAYNHQFAFEYGWADPKQNLSNYFSYLGVRRNYAYGDALAGANTLGTRGTNAATLGTLVDPNLVFFSPSFIGSNDYVDNLIYRFGKLKRQRFQIFFQGQAIKQDLDYGGFQGLTYAGGGPGLYPLQGTCPAIPPVGTPDTPANSPAQNIFCQSVIPLYPGQQAASDLVPQPDRLYSPFTSYKFEYDNAIGGSSLFGLRFFRAFSQQSQELPTQGVLAQPYGGIRSGMSADYTAQWGPRNLIKIGGSYEFARPFGTIFNATTFTAFTNPQGVLFPVLHPGAPLPLFQQSNGSNFNPTTAPGYNPFTPTGLEQDFFTPSQCLVLQIAANCGYLAQFFPNGVRMPLEEDEPTASQQIYGLFLQDDVHLGDRYKAELGARYDGYNFLIPFDPGNPPGVNAAAHQRQLEPHIGLTDTMGRRDVVRAGFGHTLAVPLPSLVSSNISSDPYLAFAKIPSYDNTTGLPAMWCGLQGTGKCASYADQMYWLVRDYRFGAQPLGTQLHGSTFTNIDVSWAHEFKDGAATKLTPFFRRGYDIVEQTAQVIGINPNTGAPVYGNTAYSNLGSQIATGVEFVYTKMVPVGWSIQAGATYINQFGNEPPGGFLTPAALASGQLFRSPDLSPFQSTFALSYHSKEGFRIAPVFSFNIGYPYGAGYYSAVFCGSNAIIVPTTDLNSWFTTSPNYVDPENPGTCTNPNIAATRGTKEAVNAGGYLSAPRYNLDVSFEWSPPGKPYTVGLQLQNVTNQIYNIPLLNTCYGSPVVTGLNYGTGPCSFNTPAYGRPDSVLGANYPYDLYPNLQPIQARLYYQLKL